jgi:hypothetical protein
VLIAPGAVLDAPETWPWVDVTAYVRIDTGIDVTTGRADEASQVNPGSASLTLDNRDGRFARRNPTSPYFGLLTFNTPIWILVDAGAGAYTLCEMFVNEWPVRWDRSGNDSTVPIVCAGVLRRINQAGVSLPPLTRTMLSAAGPVPVAYWAMDDGADATLAAASTLPGGQSMPWSAVTPAAETAAAGTGPLAQFSIDAGSKYSGTIVANGTSPVTSFYSVSFVMRGHMGSTPHPVQIQLARTATSLGAITNILAYAGYTGGAFTATRGFSIDAPVALDSVASGVNPFDGEPHTVQLRMTHTALNANTAELWIDGVLADSDTFAGALTLPITVKGMYGLAGTLDSVTVDNTGVVVGMGQMAVHDDSSVSDIGAAGFGYVGERAHVRIARLCTEEAIIYSSVASTSVALGPQPTATALDAMRDAETVDMGVLYERHFGLAYQSRAERYNAPVGLTLDFDAGDVAVEPEPTDDDQRILNRYTADRSGGATSTIEQTSGPLGSDTVGVYGNGATLNVYADSQLPDEAGWRVHVGTTDDDRWPAVALNFAATPDLISAWSALPYGSRVQIVNPPAQVSPTTIDVFIEGRSEQVDPFIWTATINTTPAMPDVVGVFDDSVLGKADTSGSTLAAQWDGASGSFTVVTTDFASGAVEWTTDSTQYPFDLNVGGQRVTVSGCSGSNPQTFTVSVASVNGYSATHATGTDVALWHKMIVGL